MKKILLAFALALPIFAATGLDTAIRIQDGSNSLYTKSSRVTITQQTNLNTGTLVVSNSITAGVAGTRAIITVNNGLTITNGETKVSVIHADQTPKIVAENPSTSANTADGVSVTLGDSTGSLVEAGRFKIAKASAWTHGTAGTFDAIAYLSLLQDNVLSANPFAWSPDQAITQPTTALGATVSGNVSQGNLVNNVTSASGGTPVIASAVYDAVGAGYDTGATASKNVHAFWGVRPISGNPVTAEIEFWSVVGVASAVKNFAINSSYGVNHPYRTLTDAATVTLTCDITRAIQHDTVTLGGNRTLAISGAVSGMEGTLIVKQDGTGSRTLTLPATSKVINGGAGAITLTTTASAIDVLSWTYDGSNYLWTYGKNFN